MGREDIVSLLMQIIAGLLLFVQLSAKPIERSSAVFYVDPERSKEENSLCWKESEYKEGKFQFISEGQLKLPFDGKCAIHVHVEFFNQRSTGFVDIYHCLRETTTGNTLDINRFRLQKDERRGSDLIRLFVNMKKHQTLKVLVNDFSAIYSFGKETYLEITCYPEQSGSESV